MKSRIIPLIIAIVGALLAIGVSTFAGPCMHDDGTTGACAAASQAVLVAGIVACAVGLLGVLFARNIQANITLSIIGVIAGIVAIASPGGLFAMCMMQTMRCWTIMRPFALVLGAVIAIVSVVMLVQGVSKRRKAVKDLPKMRL